MANPYIIGKFNHIKGGMITLDNDATKSSAALGDDYETELTNLESVISDICAELDKVIGQLKKIRDDAETGIALRDCCKDSITKIGKVKTKFNKSLKDFITAIDQEEKAEYKRLVAWYREASKHTIDDSAIGE